MPIKIPELKSRYIPVYSIDFVNRNNIHWWKNDSPFYYPNVLFNLMTCTKEQIELARQNMNGDLFLLTDSGGFQVISGTCNLTWEQSLLKQIELGASKIFAFDTPPVSKKFQGSTSQFVVMPKDEAEKIIRKNIEIAIQQSKYLKEKYPEEFKKFCYIFHGSSIPMFKYNLKVLEEFGVNLDNYTDYFPGGAVFGIKDNDILRVAFNARMAYDKFIKKGIYVHFLGMGSFYKMVILVRNKITTFDSSSALQGARANTAINPINYKNNIFIGTKDFEYTKNFCNCPVCRNVDYKQLAKDDPSLVGRYLISHNLWKMLNQNILLDSIPLDIYTKKCKELFNLPDNVIRGLEFCDESDKIGFDLAYNKYKHYLKKDITKQGSLF